MKFRALDLNLLLVLDAMFRERSVTGVASVLGLSQPSVSQSLAKLRAFYGDSLFHRTNNEMSPTPFASTLRDPLRQVLATLERDVVPAVRFNPTTSRRVFTICTSDTGELCFLPRLFAAAAERAPGVTLRTVSLPPDLLREALATGRVDLALGHFPEMDAAATTMESLTHDHFVSIVRAGHPALAGDFGLDAFLACEHAVVATRNRSRGIYEAAVERLGLVLRIRVRLEHFLAIAPLVSTTDLVATVPRTVARAVARGQAIRLIEPPFPVDPIDLAQHWHRQRIGEPEICWLTSLVRELFAGRLLDDLQA